MTARPNTCKRTRPESVAILDAEFLSAVIPNDSAHRPALGAKPCVNYGPRNCNGPFANFSNLNFGPHDSVRLKAHA